MKILALAIAVCLYTCLHAAKAQTLLDFHANDAIAWTPERSEPPADNVRFRITPSTAYFGQSGLDGGGDVSIVRGGIDLGVEWDVLPRWTFELTVENEWSKYSFDNAAWLKKCGFGFNNDHLDDTFTILRISPAVRYQINDEWAAFVGLEYRFTGSTEANFGDASVGGGYIGAHWQPNDRLSIAAGVSVVTKLDDDLDILPIIDVEYELSDQWAISTRGLGLEIEYQPTDDWSFTLFAERESREFRLADRDRLAPGGYFSDEGYLVGLEALWQCSPNVLLSLSTGFMFAQEYELYNAHNRRISSADADASPFIGLSLQISF